MLDDAQKQRIQSLYSQVIDARQFKPRYGQRLMIAHIARFLAGIKTGPEGQRVSPSAACVIEAGTGTGKTLAYLVAVLPLAVHLKKTVVISTATVALQDQLVEKDLPDFMRHGWQALREAHPDLPECQVVLAKGRHRYLCINKLQAVLGDSSDASSSGWLGDSGALAATHRRQLEALLEQYGIGAWDGDRDHWQGELDDPTWRWATTDHRSCSHRRCEYFHQCAFYRARAELDDADCIVANHDLVLADQALGGGVVLPDPKNTIFVFDEAHQLADKALGHFSHRTQVQQSRQWLQNLSKTLANLLPYVTSDGRMAQSIGQAPPLTQELDALLETCQQMLRDILAEAEGGQHRFSRGVLPEQLLHTAQSLASAYRNLHAKLDTLFTCLKASLEESDEQTEMASVDAQAFYPMLGAQLSRGEAQAALWQAFAQTDQADQPPRARWINLLDQGDSTDIAVACSPIMASAQLDGALWEPAFACVLTSATLTALGSFARLTEKCGLPEASEFHAVPSPFDYSTHARVVVPAMQHNPNDNAFANEVADWLNRNLTAKGVLVLFNSRWLMQAVMRDLDDSIVQHALCQDDLPKAEILRQHRAAIDAGEQSIILGLASFAEGIDLPGDYLTHVCIARIPFAVPDNPVESALAEWVEHKGGNAFFDMSLPDASLKLQQACGRLIRAEDDAGVVTILDRRIATKRYGRQLLDALPPFQREIQ